MHALYQAILGQFQRFPGLKSSFSGLETLVGDDTRIEFADYLNSSLSHILDFALILFVFILLLTFMLCLFSLLLPPMQ